MTVIHRYIFRSIVAAGFAAVTLFVFVLLAGNALREILGLLASGRLTSAQFLELLLLLIPYVVSYALPLGLLTGILIVLGRMSARREITAMRSAGISLWSISAPIFAAVLIGVAIAAFINNYHAPDAKTRFRMLLADSVRQDPLRFIIPRVFVKEFRGYVLYVGATHEGTLRDLWIWELDERDRVTRLHRAASGNLRYDSADEELVLTLNAGYSELRDEENPDDLQTVRPMLSFREAPRIRFPLDGYFGRKRSKFSYSALNFDRLRERMREGRNRLEISGGESFESDERALIEKDVRKCRIQIQKNFAMAFSVLSLAIVGIPLGLRAGRSETHANIAIALVLAMAYYVLVVIVGWMENKPLLRPDLLVWIPNLIFQFSGACTLAIAAKK